MRPSKRMAKWLRACFHPAMGMVHFLAASEMASQTSFTALSALGYCLRLRVNFLITLLTLSIALVVYIAFLIAGGKSNIATMSPQRRRHCLLIVGYLLSHF